MSLDRTDYKVLADKLWPYLSVRANGKVSAVTLVTNTGGSGASDFADLTGSLAPAQAPWVATDISSAVSTHAATSHHTRLHTIFDTLDHTFPAGSTFDVIGYTATNTPGKLTPSSAPSTTEKLLKTDSNGYLSLRRLTVGERLYFGVAYIEDAAGYLTISGESLLIAASSPETQIYSPDIYLGNSSAGSTTHLRSNLIDSDNADLSYLFGRTQIGYIGYANYAGFKNRSAPANGYALLSLSSGDSILNGYANTYHRIDNTDIFNTTASRVNPAGSMLKDLGDYNRKWRTGFFAELYVETLVAQDVLATIGGRIMVAPTSKLVADIVSTGATVTLHLEHNSFVVGEYLYMMAAPGGIPQIEAFKVTSGPTGSAGDYSYVCNRNLDGTGGNVWYIGDAIVSLGSALGHGYIELTSTQTILNHFGPTITHYARTGTTNWNDVKPVVSSGNLRSFADYTTDEFGIAAGNDLTLTPVGGLKGFTLDRTLGLRLFNTELKLYNSGDLLFELDNDGLFINDNAFDASFGVYIGSSTKAWGGQVLGHGDVLIGNASSYLWYDQSTATTQFKGNVDIIAASSFSGSGLLTAGNTTFSASGVSVLGPTLGGSGSYDPSISYNELNAIVIKNPTSGVLGGMFGDIHSTETNIYFHAFSITARDVYSYFGSTALSTQSAMASFQAFNAADIAVIQAITYPASHGTYPSKSLLNHVADLHLITGLVGIGNLFPAYPLHVGAGADTLIRTETIIAAQAAGAGAITVRNATDNVEATLLVGSTVGYVGTSTAHNMTLIANNTVRAAIDQSNGNFGIGNSSPLYPLHVGAGADTLVKSDTLIAAQSTSSAAITARNTTDNVEATLLVGSTMGYVGTATNHNLAFLLNNAVKGQIDVAGSMTIGGTGAPAISDGTGLDINGKILRIQTAKAPASATATGNAGEICWATGFIYVCVATNTWRRVAIATW